jgi:hypothetical protein
MKRSQLEHVIRAAGTVADDTDIVVVGSQAILGQFPEAPASLLTSMEADVYPRNLPERAELVDGTLGEGSMFHETFGYYAQGVGPKTATLPAGWEARLVRVFGPGTHGITGWCLEIHDLLVSKVVAGRPKDLDFLRAALSAGLADPTELLDRLEQTAGDPRVIEAARARVRAAAAPLS